MIVCPGRRRRGHGIEVVKIHQPGCGLIVIAANKDFSQRARTIGNFIGTGSVADYISEICHQIEGRGRHETGFQGFEVGVNVANQQDAQGSPDKLAIIAQARDYDDARAILFGRRNDVRSILRSQPISDLSI
jgi:hypothetical protein